MQTLRPRRIVRKLFAPAAAYTFCDASWIASAMTPQSRPSFDTLWHARSGGWTISMTSASKQAGGHQDRGALEQGCLGRLENGGLRGGQESQINKFEEVAHSLSLRQYLRRCWLQLFSPSNPCLHPAQISAPLSAHAHTHKHTHTHTHTTCLGDVVILCFVV